MAKVRYFEKNQMIRLDYGLDDGQIRHAIKNFYGAKQYPIIEEFQIYKNTVVDVGVIGSKSFAGIEIKSSYDDTDKLYEQMNDYIRFFHYVYVVTTKHLLDYVVKILSEPKFEKVGIMLASTDNYKDVKLTTVRQKYRIEHTRAHYDFVLSMTGMNSKLRPYLRELRNKWGIVGERNG